MTEKNINHTIVIYPGTFDPMTNGHLNIIQRASKMFDVVYVAIGANPEKNPTFTPEERKILITKICEPLKNVKVEIFHGLAVNFAKKLNAKGIVRGLRTEADFMYEMQMAMMNKSLNKDLETIFIPTMQELSHISSSLLKSVASLGGNISEYLPREINDALLKKLNS